MGDKLYPTLRDLLQIQIDNTLVYPDKCGIYVAWSPWYPYIRKQLESDYKHAPTFNDANYYSVTRLSLSRAMCNKNSILSDHERTELYTNHPPT